MTGRDRENQRRTNAERERRVVDYQRTEGRRRSLGATHTDRPTDGCCCCCIRGSPSPSRAAGVVSIGAFVLADVFDADVPPKRRVSSSQYSSRTKCVFDFYRPLSPDYSSRGALPCPARPRRARAAAAALGGAFVETRGGGV